MNRTHKHANHFIAAALVISGAAFLLKMCYLPYLVCTALGAAWLGAVYYFLRARYAVVFPAALLALVFAALQVDALGNLFKLYGHGFGPVMYDEFAHTAVQALVTPLCVWLLNAGLQRRLGHTLPLAVVILFAATSIYSLSAVYEIIEMWDELYFGGQRIWSKHDAPNDLQWDLVGILLGALAARFVLRRRAAVKLRREYP